MRDTSQAPHESRQDGAHRNGTDTQQYAGRLIASSQVRWKRLLGVQTPYRWNLKRLALGRTLDVGCGIGRNLSALRDGSLGVDHNSHSIRIARESGYSAVTTEEFRNDAARYAKAHFDSMLLSHVLEHMSAQNGASLIEEYLPYVDDKVVVICPQEKGFSSDHTHVTLLKSQELKTMLESLGLRVVKAYSFPFPAIVGKIFTYNETVLVATKRARA